MSRIKVRQLSIVELRHPSNKCWNELIHVRRDTPSKSFAALSCTKHINERQIHLYNAQLLHLERQQT